MKDAVEMALWLKKWGYMPEQVQDFYPTPGTISTVMYYTGINPINHKKVAVTTDYREKQLQRALLQYSKPENANLVREALALADREDLIGFGEGCLVKPAFGKAQKSEYVPDKRKKDSRGSRKASKVRQNANKSSQGAKFASTRAQSQMAKAGSLKKLDRVFGEDAARIRREADRLSATGTRSTKSASSQNKSRKSGKK